MKVKLQCACSTLEIDTLYVYICSFWLVKLFTHYTCVHYFTSLQESPLRRCYKLARDDP